MIISIYILGSSIGFYIHAPWIKELSIAGGGTCFGTRYDSTLHQKQQGETSSLHNYVYCSRQALKASDTDDKDIPHLTLLHWTVRTL